MKTGTVVVQDDYLQKITATRNPLRAIEELIWNGLDADADEVFVEFAPGLLTKLGEIRVTDKGTGIPHAEAEKLFESLGGYWKSKQEKTPKGRFIHGKNGQGRFKAFALGQNVTWETTYRDRGKVMTYTIAASATDLREFTISDPVPSQQTTGTVCTITDIHRDYRIWGTDEAMDEVSEIFALYLYDNRHVKLVYDGTIIDPASVISHLEAMPLTAISKTGTELIATLTAIEWSSKAKRFLYLCTSKNFPLHKLPPGIKARGFKFTAYLSASLFDSFADGNKESLLELDADAAVLVDAAKDRLRDHFRAREAALARDRVDEWIS